MKSLIANLFAVLAANLTLQAQQPCVMATYGQGCGPVLTGTVTPSGGTQRVTFAVTNAYPRAAVLFMLGFNELNIPIPGTIGCALLTDLAFTQVHQVDASGNYSWSRALPNDPTGPTVRIQYLEISLDAGSQLVLRTTNGVTMTCP